MEELLVQRLNRPIQGNRTAFSIEGKAVLATTVGLIRKENEDRAIVARFFSQKLNVPIYCYILSDGMGGMANGGLAATLTVTYFLTKLVESIDSKFSVEDSIKAAVQEAHKKVCASINFKGGATLSAIIAVKPGELYAVNVGDSRIYQCTTESLLQITEDDDIKNFLSKIKGIEVNNVIAQRNGLTKFIGMEGDLEISVDHCSSSSDFFIISDGISLIGEENLNHLYENKTSDSEFLQRCIHLSNWFGGKDNATGIYISLSQLYSTENIDNRSSDFIEIWDFQGSLIISKPKSLSYKIEDTPLKTKPKKKNIKTSRTHSLKSENIDGTVEIEQLQNNLFTDSIKNDDLPSKNSEISIETTNPEKKK